MKALFLSQILIFFHVWFILSKELFLNVTYSKKDNFDEASQCNLTPLNSGIICM